jgi:hypothetical protein
MKSKPIALLVFGIPLLLASFALGWRALGPFDTPTPAIVYPIAAIITFVLAVSLIAVALPGLRNVESPPFLSKLGTVALLVGGAVSAYAAAVFFGNLELPPNTQDGRLPSLYLLFAGMAAMFVGTAVRSFRLRR